MKKVLSLSALLSLSVSNASVVAIMDSGTDISHAKLASKVWVNPNEVEGSTEDLDGSGLPGDVNGWDFIAGSAKVFDGKYNHLLTAEIVKFYKIYAQYETKSINQENFDWLKEAVNNAELMNRVNFIGGYAHGTHVGGIAADRNSKAKIMSLKTIPTEYQEYVVAPIAKARSNDWVQMEFDFAPEITFDDILQEVAKAAVDQVRKMIPLNGYLDFHKVDVVNQSFGIGFGQAQDFLTSFYIANMNKAPSQDELVKMLGTYFGTILYVGPKMFEVAPNTLFIIASGNDGSNNDQFPDYPSSIEAPNRITVAASYGSESLADFSNYGAKSVDVAAPGVAMLSTSPAHTMLYMSGTSQAAPYVTNAVALAKDINEKLTVVELKEIILKTVDVKSWLKDKVKTSGVVNRARVERAAHLSKILPLEKAISRARAEIADAKTEVLDPVLGTKSMKFNFPTEKLKFKPLRPSLLVKAAK